MIAAPPVTGPFAASLRNVTDVLGCYVGGSVAAGDYQPGVSDLDLVAVVADEPTAAEAERLAVLHLGLIRTEPVAAKLHCAYLPQPYVSDVDMEHLVWAHGELYRRPVSRIARAELHAFGLTVFGPPPAELIPPVSPDQLAEGARAELTGYWSVAAGKPALWLQITSIWA